MTATLKPCRRSPALGLPGTPDSLLAGVDLQTIWSTPVIYLSASDPTQLGMPEFAEAFWCYVAKPIDWDWLQEILARLFPHQPPLQGTPGSGGEATPHLLPLAKRLDHSGSTQIAETTASRYMNHLLQEWGVNPLVIPNGLSIEAPIRPEHQAMAAFRARLRHRTVLCKVARWDPNKRWLLAIAIVGALKQQGCQPR
jgi:hypothetical protein